MLLLMLCLFQAPPVPAPPAPAPAPSERATPLDDAALAQALRELATFGQECKLHAEVAGLWPSILVLDPECSVARKALGHRRRKGEWIPPRRPKRAKSTPKAAAERHGKAFAERLEALLGPRRQAALAQHAAQRKASEHAAARSTLARALALEPEHPTLRLAGGEVQARGRWRLAASIASSQHLDQVEALRNAALDGLGAPEERSLDPIVATLGLPFGKTWGLGTLEVAATGRGDEGKTALLGAATAISLARQLGADEELFSSLEFHLLTRPAQAAKWLQHPGLGEEERAWAEKLLSTWVGSGLNAQWAPDQERRLDGTVRQTLLVWLERSAGIPREESRWFCEGFSGWITHLSVGTRLTRIVARPDYDRGEDALLSRMSRPKADWLGLALETLEDRKSGLTPLRRLVRLDWNGMGPVDALTANAFVQMLLTGHPERRAALWSAFCGEELELDFEVPEEAEKEAEPAPSARPVGAPPPPPRELVLLARALGIGTNELEERFHRWLREVIER